MSTYDTDTTNVGASRPASWDGKREREMALSTEAASDPEKTGQAKMKSEENSTEPVAAASVREAPDGGTRAWLVILGAWCASYCSWGWINAVGVFQEYYQSTILSEYSSSTVSWITSLQIFFMMAGALPMGILYDRYGAKWMVFIGSFLHVFGIMMASLSTTYYQILLSQGVCSALGLAAVFSPTLACVPGWFSSKRGTAYGVIATGSSVGGITLPIMVNRMIPMVGFGWTMRTLGFIFLALLVITNLTIKPFNPPTKRKLTLEMFWRPFTEYEFATLAAGMAIFTWGLYVPMNYLQVEAVAHGMRQHLVNYLVAMFGAGSLFGRLLSGVFGDRCGLFNVFIVVCFVSAIWILGLWIPANNDACRIAFAVLYGFFSGAYVSQLPALVAQVSPLRDMGMRTGLMFFATAIPALTTNPIAGAILGDGESAAGNWAGAKAFAGVFCFAGTLFVVATRFYKSKELMAKV